MVGVGVRVFLLPRWRVVAVLLTVMSSADDELALLYAIPYCGRIFPPYLHLPVSVFSKYD